MVLLFSTSSTVESAVLIKVLFSLASSSAWSVSGAARIAAQSTTDIVGLNASQNAAHISLSSLLTISLLPSVTLLSFSNL